ncbi:hypothetical protein VC188_08745 [Polynucleobacter sp. MG-28-Ekke-A2]|uniref:hypothetical protein n=1 Tax=Polynucleobacter sp. MG-28-Ekke-A2 TaxID=3108276 RepID=UPI002B237704|nr:hypothetical protein [Polynucleobacter sp. MG-28-Ekke-A2]MEA9602205.1 hypothetical protein [Polynucleobacter sp. MG-28-Ekke-A2]
MRKIQNTPVQILEAVGIARERLWTSTLQQLAAGKADQWFDSSSPALIMIGEAFRTSRTLASDTAEEKMDECLQKAS